MSGSATVKWVNHASYVLETDDAVLLSDPWFGGTAFDDGWAQYSPTHTVDELMSRITHIWISHEHPDHFSPAAMRSFAEEHRSNITVLFQASRDRRVANYCRRLGYQTVREMRPNEWMSLGENLRVMCNPWRLGDSYLAAETPAGLVLNVNDCVIRTQREANAILADLDGRSPRVLLTQFSYANRIGNPDQTDLRRKAARAELESLITQVGVFEPEFVIPYASFIWFCHAENGYMNDAMSSPADAVQIVHARTGSKPVVMYPGDSWDMNQTPKGPENSVGRYRTDLDARLRSGPIASSTPSLSFDILITQGDRFGADVCAVNGRLRTWILERLHIVPTATVWIDDLQRSVALGCRGLKLVDCDRRTCDISMTSGALSFMLTNRFGGTTLFSNGRFTGPELGDVNRIVNLVNLRDANNRGRSCERWLLARVLHRVEHALPATSALARWLRSHR